MIIVYNMFKENFNTSNIYDRKTSENLRKKRTKQQPGVDPMNCACEIYSTPVE